MPRASNGLTKPDRPFFGKRFASPVLSLTLIAAVPVSAQGAEPTRPAPVVSVTLSLVQVDAVVTDADHRAVTDLKADDFEILEDGKRQEITNCAYVPLREPPSASLAAMPASGASDPNRQVSPPLRAENVRRTIALVVDDLGLSLQGAVVVRSAVHKFVRDQMMPGDLVAIIRTGSGAGALQQFTADKRLLEAVADRIRYNPIAPLDIFEPMGSDEVLSRDGATSAFGNPRRAAASWSNGEDAEQWRRDTLTVGTLGALRAVIAGLRDLPGRKSMLLFSEGFHFGQSKADNSDLLERIRDIAEVANRASVVVYAVDSRGLQTRSLTAADDLKDSSGTGPSLAETLSTRRSTAIDKQEGLAALADQTGGLFFHDQTVTKAVDRILEDQRGYYLIGYAPEASTFQGLGGHPTYHKIKVNLKRPGLHLRSRAGFFGVADRTDGSTAPRTLAGALLSPFEGGDLKLSLSSLFLHKPPQASFMRSFLYIDGKDITFTKGDDGQMTARIDMVAVTFGDGGAVVDQIGRGKELKMTPEGYASVLKNGIVYTINVPIRKPGAYQLRVALRDLATGHVGSASQFVQVPSVKKDHLALSGLLVTGARPDAIADSREGAAVADENAAATQAVRRFRPGSVLMYGCMVYNAKTRGGSSPKLLSQMRLFHDGREIKKGAEIPVDVTRQEDGVFTGGGFQLGTGMAPGSYLLELAITDTLADRKHGRVTQTIDFEVAS